MNKIQKLSLHEAQKIAAGEVIDRPAHCIKELLENSIDARATAITVECTQAGKESMIVTDNGSGISYDDLLIAYHRHTTSKIRSCDDLQNLTTFGFRGEALASMCAVARVLFTTKTIEDDYATELIVENQQIVSERPAARVVGTTVQIDNLFGIVPARKKFLKKDATEWNQCLAVLKSFIAQHCNIHFIVKHDGYLVYNCPAVSSYKDRLHQLYGSQVEPHLYEIGHYAEKGIMIEGTVTDVRYGRFDKSGIFIFVNKRLVKNYHLVKALLQGYEHSLQPGKFPAAIVSITVDPTVIDVNVHPKKEEILFQFPHMVDKALSAAAKQTLVQSQKMVSSALPYGAPFVPHATIAPEKNLFLPAHKVDSLSDYVPMKSDQSYKEIFDICPISYASHNDTILSHPALLSEQKNNTIEQQAFIPYEYNLVGIYKRTYFMVEDEQGLLFIDQHALHERMLYNKWSLQESSFETIALLFPITFSLLEEEISMLQPYLHLLQQFGIVFEPLGPTLFRITSVPVFLKQEPLELIIREVLTWIYEEKEIEQEALYIKLTDKLRTLIACKSAVKAGDNVANEMVTKLLQYFYTSDNCLTCPHGRPVSWRISLTDLEKKFKRDYR